VTSLALVVGFVALAAGALRVYEVFAGEHPILDAIYDVRLRRQNIDRLDALHLANPRQADIIVTLTTLPSRIDRMALTIKSLLRQSVRPSAIRINIPYESRREGVPYRIPEWLARLRSVTIVRGEDYGPATKLIPTLLDSTPDARLLVVDDDRIYHPYFVEQMTALADAHPGAAVAASGWDAPDDRIDRPTKLLATLLGRAPAPIKCTRVRGARDVDIVQGLSGYVVQPRFFDLEAIVDYAQAPAAAFFVDDVWISAHCRARKLVCGGRRTNCPSVLDARAYKRSSVSRVNRGTGTPESRNNTIMLQYFRDRWRSANGTATRT
jgi:hypothetical protein